MRAKVSTLNQAVQLEYRNKEIKHLVCIMKIKLLLYESPPFRREI